MEPVLCGEHPRGLESVWGMSGLRHPALPPDEITGLKTALERLGDGL